MKSGRKPATPAEHVARGTRRADRLTGQIEAMAGDVLPPAGSLTDHGLIVWDELAPRAVEQGTLKPADGIAFSIMCNLVAQVQQATRAGDAPPAAHLSECRRLLELFGLAGERSRVVGGAAPAKPAPNPFLLNGRAPR